MIVLPNVESDRHYETKQPDRSHKDNIQVMILLLWKSWRNKLTTDDKMSACKENVSSLIIFRPYYQNNL